MTDFWTSSISRVFALAFVAANVSAFAPAVLQQPKVTISSFRLPTTFFGDSARPDMRLSKTSMFAEKNPIKIIIAGAPASGKGTQCEIIKETFGLVHLSTGNMLRAAVAAATDVGRKAKGYMDSGKLVPDEVIIGVVSRII